MYIVAINNFIVTLIIFKYVIWLVDESVKAILPFARVGTEVNGSRSSIMCGCSDLNGAHQFECK